jgi:acetyltransferase-like isoleucine patch superfamily enzyme
MWKFLKDAIGIGKLSESDIRVFEGAPPIVYERTFKSIGRGCKISPHAKFYGIDRIEIGDNVRIDDFCIISAGEGGIKIGSNIHIAAHCFMAGAAQIQIDDYVGVGVRSVVHSSSDDFSGNFLIGPQLTKEHTNVKSEKVWLKKYSVLGAGCIVLPGVTVDEGCAVGAMSLVRKSLPSYQIWGGNPIKFIRTRETRMTRFTEPMEKLSDSVYLDGIDWYVTKT